MAISCVVVILAQSAATARAYSVKYKETFDPNADLLGLCAANAAAGMGGTFVVNGSPTQTATAESAGGRSQLTHITAALTVMLILLFLTGPLGDLPEAALASIVFLIGVKLVKVGPLKDIYRRSPGEFWVAIITAATVVGVGVREGILLALVLSLLQHVKRGYRPPTAAIVRDPVRHWRMDPPEPGRTIVPGLMLYWFGAASTTPMRASSPSRPGGWWRRPPSRCAGSSWRRAPFPTSTSRPPRPSASWWRNLGSGGSSGPSSW